MSVNRQNIIWPAPADAVAAGAKPWRIGFWEFYGVNNQLSEDWNPEWDVEYSNDAFWWVGEGMTVDEAEEAYYSTHANPGGYDDLIATRTQENEAGCARLDRIFEERREYEAELQQKAKSSSSYRKCLP